MPPLRPTMSQPPHSNSSTSQSDQDRRSFQTTMDEANRAIAETQAQIARSRALGQAEADLARTIDRMSQVPNDSPEPT